MEASEQQQVDQLPLDARGAVRALGDRLVIESLTVSDERAARLVRERAEAGQDPAETVASAIEVGARVLESEGTAANVDYVKREFQESLGSLGTELGEALEEGTGELAEVIAATFGADRSDSVQEQIKTAVAEHVDKRISDLTGKLSAEDASNPLNAIQVRATTAMLEAEERHRKETRAMQEQISGLRENLGRVLEKQEADDRVAEAEEAGTRKGRSFEERVHDALERIAEGRGDVALHTGDVKGEGGSKKGDTVVEIGAAEGPCAGRIVFEDKDRQLSKNKMRDELNGAMAEREADFAVLVVAGEDRIPAGHEQLTEYEGDKLIVAVDPDEPDALGLRLAYRYARLRVVMARDGALEVDAGGVRDAAEKARAALKRAQKVRLALSNIDKSTKSAREHVDGMVAEVEIELTEIEGLIAAADTD
ncbi:MAG TPA: hypothetical protein VKA36_05500 [Solirubrobacterales bacterium]|nr:hypothetical protein [Solirubrobacterales bacterium]